MKNNKDKISDYVLGKLNENERLVFEEALKNDTELQEQLAFEQLIAYSAQKENYLGFLKDTLAVDANIDDGENSVISESVINETNERGRVIEFRWKRLFSFAAIVTLVIATYLLFNNNSSDLEQLAEKYEDFDGLKGNVKGQNIFIKDRNDSIYYMLISLTFDKKKSSYSDFIDYSEKLLDRNEDFNRKYGSTLELDIIYSLIKNDQFVQAHQKLLGYKPTSNIEICRMSWYEAICMMYQNESVKTKVILKELVSDDCFQKVQAQDLLEQMEDI